MASQGMACWFSVSTATSNTALQPATLLCAAGRLAGTIARLQTKLCCTTCSLQGNSKTQSAEKLPPCHSEAVAHAPTVYQNARSADHSKSEAVPGTVLTFTTTAASWMAIFLEWLPTVSL